MIRIHKLSKRYDRLLAVDELSLEIPEGQVLGLLGPNGAGKSTTLRILTGFLPPSSGTVFVDGLDIRFAAEQAKGIMGYLPESSPLYPDMLVFDYLDYIAAVHRLKEPRKTARIKELARLCGIAEVMHQEISRLSKGYRQRVGLALAMMGDPKILVLDEPTSGLDPNQIGEIRRIIKEIGRRKTVIFSTHILSEAEATCDRVVIIDKGRIAADGTMAELRRRSAGGTGLRLTLRGAPDAEVWAVLGVLPRVREIVLRPREEGAEYCLTTDGDQREAVYGALKKQDWVLLNFQREEQSLEHLFKELTRGGDGHAE